MVLSLDLVKAGHSLSGEIGKVESGHEPTAPLMTIAAHEGPVEQGIVVHSIARLQYVL